MLWEEFFFKKEVKVEPSKEKKEKTRAEKRERNSAHSGPERASTLAFSAQVHAYKHKVELR